MLSFCAITVVVAVVVLQFCIKLHQVKNICKYVMRLNASRVLPMRKRGVCLEAADLKMALHFVIMVSNYVSLSGRLFSCSKFEAHYKVLKDQS